MGELGERTVNLAAAVGTTPREFSALSGALQLVGGNAEGAVVAIARAAHFQATLAQQQHSPFGIIMQGQRPDSQVQADISSAPHLVQGRLAGGGAVQGAGACFNSPSRPRMKAKSSAARGRGPSSLIADQLGRDRRPRAPALVALMRHRQCQNQSGFRARWRQD